MIGPRRRGRPRKTNIFSNGESSRRVGRTALGETLLIGQREFFAQLRKEFGVGSCVNIDLIFEVMKEEGGPLQQETERALAAAKAAGGEARATLIEGVKRDTIQKFPCILDRVQAATLSVNSAASVIRKALIEEGGDGWKPSNRTLRDWIKGYRAK